MSSREHQLLSRIIRTGAINHVISWGITNKDFMAGETRAMFDHILGYNMAYRGSVVGPEAARQMYPTFQLCDDPYMHIDALCQEVRNNRLAIEGGKRIAEVQALLQADPVGAVGMLNAVASDMMSLTGNSNTDVRAGDAFTRILKEYQLRKNGYTTAICNWPWWPIQNVTGGMEPSDYIVFYGRPKSKKSWVLAYMISWLVNNNKRGVIYTKEMGADDIFKRILACLAEVAYEGLRLGTMDATEEEAVYIAHRMFEVAQTEGSLICLSGQDCNKGGDTVPWLRSKVEMYKPDFVAVDGMYLMADIHNSKKDNERVRNISRDLRQLTLSTKVMLLATLQANRSAAKNQEANLDEIAFSDAIGQDATHIFRIINEKGGTSCAIVTGGGREFTLNGWRIYAIPATNFECLGLLSEKEIEKAKEGDTGDVDTQNGAHNGQKAASIKPPNPTFNQATKNYI